MAEYMKLSKKLAERDMKQAKSDAEAATKESDKEFTEYFNKYGGEGYQRSRK